MLSTAQQRMLEYTHFTPSTLYSGVKFAPWLLYTQYCCSKLFFKTIVKMESVTLTHFILDLL